MCCDQDQRQSVYQNRSILQSKKAASTGWRSASLALRPAPLTGLVEFNQDGRRRRRLSSQTDAKFTWQIAIGRRLPPPPARRADLGGVIALAGRRPRLCTNLTPEESLN